MVRRGRGVALHLVMVIVTVMLFLASAMVALGMMNLNLSQSFYNGSVALDEAEAGVTRLLYALGDNPGYGAGGTAALRGRMSEGYDDDQAGYVVTFDRGSRYPWSVNNAGGGQPEGYRGRTVPKDMILAYVTGFCRGQYRTIEVLVERPPFPFALATSGRIRSNNPLHVEGTDSVAQFQAGDNARPGHLVSNHRSKDEDDPAIYIGKDEGNPSNRTFISGFVQSAGLVDILQPAVVRGGIRPSTEAVKLPDIPISRFDNQGQEGVVEIAAGTFGEQTLDVMYHSSHDLEYNGKVTLDNGFLFVKGDLAIQGGIEGRGAIVVDGNVTISGDAELRGTNKVAVVASGDVTLDGAGNFFQGLVYSRGNVSARNLTVLGNMIVSSSDRDGGGTTLENVRVVSNPDYAAVRFTASSSSDAEAQQETGDLPFAITDLDGYPYIGRPTENGGGYRGWYAGPDCTFENIYGVWKDKIGSITFGPTAGAPADAAGLMGMAGQIQDLAVEYQELKQRMDELTRRIAGLDRDDPATPRDEGAERSRLEGERAALQARADPLALEYDALVQDLARAYVEYYKSHADRDGRYKKDGKTIDVFKDYRLDLNEFLPASDNLRVRYWHVHNARL